MSFFEILFGKLGISVALWVQENYKIAFIILGSYLLIIVFGKFQEYNIERNINYLILQAINDLKENGSLVSPSSVEKKIKPIWLMQSRKWGLFILDKRGLFPTKINSEKIYSKFIDMNKIKEIIDNEKL